MQIKLYSIISLLSISFISGSCKKWLPENRIEGNWSLTEVQKRRVFDNETVATGFEKGTFTFNENGTAVYTEGANTLRGSWQMRNENRQGYYDNDGNWQSNNRRVLIVRLWNFNNNSVIDWYFDRFDFRLSGKSLFAFIESPNYNYRYCFNKK